MEDCIRQLFTAEARTAARVRRAEQAGDQDTAGDGFGIVVVAVDGPLPAFRWELRQLDGLVLARSLETFRTKLLARYAGVRALVGD